MRRIRVEYYAALAAGRGASTVVRRSPVLPRTAPMSRRGPELPSVSRPGGAAGTFGLVEASLGRRGAGCLPVPAALPFRAALWAFYKSVSKAGCAAFSLPTTARRRRRNPRP
jgi:hypothetical protein